MPYEGPLATALLSGWLQSKLPAAQRLRQGQAVVAYVFGDARSTAERLVQLGIAPTRIAGDSCSCTTCENATFTAAQLGQHQPGAPVLLITDPWQLPRARRPFTVRISSLSLFTPTHLYPRLIAIAMPYKKLPPPSSTACRADSDQLIHDVAQTNSKPWFLLLDVLRGPAAILVFAEHLRNLFFKDFPDLDAPAMGIKLFYLFSGAGHEAVMIFFVLSGCVIAHVTFGMVQQGRWSWSAYLSARLTRLWVVLLPALVLTAIWDRLGIFLSRGKETIYAGDYGNVLVAPVAESLDLHAFLGNLFFLQKILVPPYGSNGPLWSISYEFVYYIAFPLIFLGFHQSSRLSLSRFFSLALAIGLLIFAGRAVCEGFFVWFMGVSVYFLYRKKPLLPRFALPGFLLGVVLILVCVVASRLSLSSGFLPWDLWLGLVSAVAVYAGLSAKPSITMQRITGPLQEASAVSYSIYLFHTPLLVFIASLLFRSNASRWVPDLIHLSVGALIALLVSMYCLLGWHYTERRTKDVRVWLAAFSPL